MPSFTVSLTCIFNDIVNMPKMQLINPNVIHFLTHQLVKYTPHCNENPIYVFLFWEMRSLSPNFHNHVYVSGFIYYRDWSTYFPAAE
jgi:hypothetical protein